MGAAYGSCGERCMAIPLVVAVGDATADAVVAGLKIEIAKMKVGPGTDAACDMGPLVTRAHFDKVRGYVDQGVKEGATLVVDGRGVSVPGHENGYFLGACLFDNVKPGMVTYQEEIFGPVLGVVRVQTLQEAMDMIDAHEYGNGTCIFTRDGEAARFFSDHIQVGMVGINVPLPVPVAYHSFGGWKRQPVRRPARLRPGCRALLYQAQDHHPALAVGGCARGGGVQFSEQPLKGFDQRRSEVGRRHIQSATSAQQAPGTQPILAGMNHQAIPELSVMVAQATCLARMGTARWLRQSRTIGPKRGWLSSHCS